MYENFSWEADRKAILNWADTVLLVSLRSGHTPLLRMYAYLLDPVSDLTCPLFMRNTGCRDAQISASSCSVHAVILHPHSESSRALVDRASKLHLPHFCPSEEIRATKCLLSLIKLTNETHLTTKKISATGPADVIIFVTLLI